MVHHVTPAALPLPLSCAQASGHKVDFDDWHKSVHYGQLEYNELLKPDVSLRELLCRYARRCRRPQQVLPHLAGLRAGRHRRPASRQSVCGRHRQTQLRPTDSHTGVMQAGLGQDVNSVCVDCAFRIIAVSTYPSTFSPTQTRSTLRSAWTAWASATASRYVYARAHAIRLAFSRTVPTDVLACGLVT